MGVLRTLSLALAGAATLTTAQSDYGSSNDSLANAPYKDAGVPIEERISDLLGRMTLQEKASQLMQGDISNWLNTTSGEFNQTGLEESFHQKAGSFYVGYPISWEWLADNIKVAQDYAVNETRLGIPAIVQTESIHGFLIGNATIFNSPIAYGCAFNRSQIHEMTTQIAREAQALGVNQLFAPVVDLARELRFGRVEECFSEDPYLTGEYGYAYVDALQSMNISAQVKHFAGSSGVEQGLNTGPVHGGERELRRTWLPPYHKAIIGAGAWSVMSAYTSYDGVPSVSDYHLLTQILREEWGYDYYVMSDAGATNRLADPFMICPEPLNDYNSPITEGNECVALDVLPAGGDVEMGGGSFNFRSIPQLVEAGRMEESAVDTAVGRVLRVKFAMGLFERPYEFAPQGEWEGIINNDYAKKLARELDRDSIVLLKNHEETLPLAKNQSVAVIGPMADFMNYGDYVVFESSLRGVTPLDGVRNAMGNNASITYAQGCERWSNDESGFPEAIEAAEGADVAVVVVGTWSRDQGELWSGLNATTGEAVDVDDLSLVGAMRPLLEAIIATDTPTVVVFQSGKPITEPWLSNTTASLVQQFYPGQEGGDALADILFGSTSPSGKLSVSFPHSVGNLPIHYDYLNSGRTYNPGFEGADGELYFGRQYVLGTPMPWFEFGFGLSYTTFDYSNVTLSARNVTAAETITASLSVTNNGTRDGAEVVQMYVQDVLASVDHPNIELKGFEKVHIPAGETVEVTMQLAVQDCGVWDRRMQYVVEPGEFVVWVGSSSMDLRGNATFHVG